MTPEEYRRLEKLFHPALELPPDQRREFLDRECADAPELRQRLEVMLANVAAKSEVLPHGHPERIGPYRILETLGEGGMGVVYLAEQQEPIRRQVALKLIRRGMETREVLARFELERQALALMDHPGIARVFDVGQSEEARPYFVMEFIAGEPITRFCDHERLTLAERLEIFVQVCDAVHHAHLKGIIHRDLKPSNIIVSRDGDRAIARVIDFGIAKATELDPATTRVTATDRFVGTPEYTSPEQVGIGASDVDLRTDIYSLGILLYELIAGQRPHDSPTGTSLGIADWMRALVSKPVRAPSARVATRSDAQSAIAEARATTPGALRRRLRGELDWITLRAIELERERRYPSVRDLAEDVRRYLRREPVQVGPPGVAYRLRKLFQRHPGSVLTAGASLIALLVGAIVVTFLYVDAEHARESADTSFREAQIALEARNRALREKDRALEQKDRALRRSEGLRLTARALTLAESEPGTALQLAVQGARRHEGLEARNALYRLLDDFVEHRFLEGHTGMVVALAISPDGQRVATGSADGTARLWDVRSARSLALLHGLGLVSHVAFSPSGDRLVTCSGSASIWSAADGREIVRLRGHGAAVRCAEFSPDGERVATSSHDRTIRLWNARDGSELARLEGHGKSVFPLVFSPDGSRLASGSRDGTARIWELATGRSLVLEHRGKTLSSVAFRSDGDEVLTTSVSSVLRTWDARTGELRRRIPCGSQLVRARYDASGDWIGAAGLDGVVRIFGRESATPVQELHSHDGPVTDLILDSRRGVAYTCGFDKTIRIWSLDSGAQLARLEGHTDRVQRLALSPGGTLVSASFDHRAAIWPSPLRTVLAPLGGALPAVRDAAFLSGGRMVSVHADGSLRVWSAADFTEEASWTTHDDRITDTVVDPGERWLATSSWSGGIRIQSPEDGRLIARLSEGTDDVLGLAHSPAGLLVSRTRGGEARVWSTDDWRLLKVLGDHEDVVQHVAVSDDGKHALTVGRDVTARLWDVESGRELHRQRTRVAALAPSGSWWCWSNRRGVFLAGLEPESEPRALEAKGQSARSIAFSPGGKLLLAALGNDSSRVWTVPDGRVLWDFDEDETTPETVGFSPTEEIAYTVSREGSLRLWNLVSGAEEAAVKPRAFRPWRVTFDASGQHLLAVSKEGELRHWPLDILAAVERWLPRSLSAREADRFEIGDAAERSRYRRARGLARLTERLEVQESMLDRGAASRRVVLDILPTVNRLLKQYAGPETPEMVEALAERCIDRGDSLAVPLLVSVSRARRASGRKDLALLALERARALPATPTRVTGLLEALRSDSLRDATTCRSIDALLEDAEGDTTPTRLQQLAKSRWDPRHRTYLEARLAERAGQFDRALAGASELVKREDACGLRARLLVARCRVALGDPQAAEICLRSGLRFAKIPGGEFWSEWFRLGFVELGRRPAEMLEALASEGIEAHGRAACDALWLLEVLDSETPIRINCGGPRHEDSRGREWSEDRFFASGDRLFGTLHGSHYLVGLHEAIEGTEDPALYRDARLFRPTERPSLAYRLPLPPGEYDVTLHFAGTVEKPRSFDVSLQGETVLSDYDPRRGRSVPAVDPKTFEVAVRDGFLALGFMARTRYPYIAAIEIARRAER